ncbi:helix-turn-helix transcriptional regulator [uncultured Megasphaera sp.]|uniref:helix-turn-helix transcriptional regulator n=1 Tax=uncultured Megasphaera sp. TaxID=165188 RepID=UPI0026597E93|nr:helix-turn-helix transcriptional regulator [uncultured Megasphaera sp.]
MTLGQEIRFYRKKKGLTQTEFGALFGMSKQAVYSWETGLYSPDISVLLKMADYFQIPICILVGRPGIFCKGVEEDHADCQHCASITEKDSRIIRAIHALPAEQQHAIEVLLHVDDANTTT